MKKIVLLAAFIVGGIGAMNAQEMFQFGVKGGANFASITNGNDAYDNESGRTSFNIGVLAEIPVSEKFSIQPEVLYSAQGATLISRDEDNIFDTDENVEYQLDYIQVPVLAKVYLVDGLNFQVGPSFNFKANEEIDYAPQDDGGDVNLDEAKSFDMGAAAGLEYKFNNGFFINGRYTYGFTELYDNSDLHNSVIQAGVGFMF